MVDLEFDVLVVGGGVAGMSAALASARCGAKTLLLEKRPQLGGILRAGLGFPLCGFFDSHANLLNEGFSRELFEAGDISPERMGRVHIWPCPPEELLHLFSTRLAAERNLAVWLESEAVKVEMRDGRMVGVAVGRSLIHPKAGVDCSGDGAVIAAADAERLEPDNEMLAGYSIRFCDLKNDPMLPLKVPYVLRKSGLPAYLGFSLFSPPDLLKLAVPATLGAEALRRDVDAVVEYLKSELPAFRTARIAETSPQILRREGIRLKGKYVLTKEDVLGGARFGDAVAKCAWPIEHWRADNGPQFKYLPDGTFYEIPLRCLESSTIGNLFAAGRCLSATSEALASARVMGTCIATGEAAGRAAAEFCL